MTTPPTPSRERRVRALVFEAVIQASQHEVVNATFTERQEVRKEIADEWGDAILSVFRDRLASLSTPVASDELIERAAMIVFEEVGNNTVCERTMRRIRALATDNTGDGM